MKAPYVSVYTTKGKRPPFENRTAHPSDWEEYQQVVFEVAYNPLLMGEVKDNFGGLPQWGLDHLEPYERAIGALPYRGRMVTFRVSRASWGSGISAIHAEIIVPGVKKITYDGDDGTVSTFSTDGWCLNRMLAAVIDDASGKVVWRTHMRYVQKHEVEHFEFVGATVAAVRSQTVAMMSPFMGALGTNWLPNIGLSVRSNEDGGSQSTTDQYRAVYEAVRAHRRECLPLLENGGYKRIHYDLIVDEVKRLLAK